MDSIQLERLYVLIDAQTTEFNKQMDKVNAKIDEVSNTTKVSTGKASKMFTRFGKMVAAAFVGSEINSFLKKLTELSSKSLEFKATTDAAMRALADTLTPVLETIIKYTAMAIAWITGLIRAMFNLKVETKAVTKETKALAKTYAGFDELNVITQPAADPGDTAIKSLIDIEKYIKEGQKFWAQFGDTIKFVGGLLAAYFAGKAAKNITGFFVDLQKLPIAKWFKKAADNAGIFLGSLDKMSKSGQALDTALEYLDEATIGLSELAFPKMAGSLEEIEVAMMGTDDVILQLTKDKEKFSKAIIQSQDDILAAATSYDDAASKLGIFGTMITKVSGATGLSAMASAGLIAGAALTALGLAVIAVNEALKPSIRIVDELGTGISKATKEALEPMTDAISDLETDVKLFNLKELITQEDVDYLIEKVNTITNEVLKKLREERDAALTNLLPLKELMSEEDFNELLQSTEDYFKKAEQEILDGQARIKAIYDAAAKENRQLTIDEQATVLGILQGFQDTTVDLYAESAADITAIRNRLRNDLNTLTDEEKVELYNKALASKEEMIGIAQDQYDAILLEAERLRGANIISEEVYDKIKSSAATAKDDAIAEAQDLVDGVKDVLGDDFLNNINESNGKILSAWDAFWKEMKKKTENFQTTVAGIKIGGSVPKTGTTGNIQIVETPAFNWAKIGYAAGGMPSTGSLFVAGESGAELIGSHSGKTTVMPLENTSFVSAMSDAVYGAVSRSLAENAGSGQTVIQVDGLTLAKSVEDNLNKLATVQGGLKIAF